MRYGLATLIITASLAGCSLPYSQDLDAATPPASPGASATVVADARAALPDLAIDPGITAASFDREALFGHGWHDPDHNGCSARADVLRRDVPDVQPPTGCARGGGTLHDPYTGTDVPCCAAVQVDHVYPLKRAYEHGAAGWAYARRVAFANDPLELVATSAHANESKGDSGPEGWMPVRADWCAYSATYVLVAARYRLSVTADDRDVLRTALATCPA